MQSSKLPKDRFKNKKDIWFTQEMLSSLDMSGWEYLKIIPKRKWQKNVLQLKAIFMTICPFKVFMLYGFENPIKMSHHVSFSPRPDLPQYGHTLGCSKPIKTSYRYNTWKFWLIEIVMNVRIWGWQMSAWRMSQPLVINPHFRLLQIPKIGQNSNLYS